MKVQVCAEDILRVACAPDRNFFDHPSLAVLHQGKVKHWDFDVTGDNAILSTAKLKAVVDLKTGAVSFLDAAGHPILAEKRRELLPATVQGDTTFHVRQEWEAQTNEALYGLGQQQLGLMNIKGYDLDLWQYNGTIAIPFLVSSRGYGILWDNTSYTRFGDLRQAEPIPASQLFDTDGTQGGLTASYFSSQNFKGLLARRREASIDITITNDTQLPELPANGASVRWEGEVLAPETGDYTFHLFSNYGIKLWVDNQLVTSYWHQRWQPWKNVARVHLEAGHRYHLKLEWVSESGGQRLQLLWKTPSHDPNTSLWSEVGEGTDYYFCYGPALDSVIGGYRHLTGEAPLMPIWAYGFWQCRQRYETAQQSLNVLAGYRSRGIPIDNIVQDWFYWKKDAWGSHEFDPARFPDPVGWIRAIHEKYHAHLMISVWPKFYPGTKNFEALRSRGFLYEAPLGEEIKDWMGYPYTFYDAFNPEARKLFWAQINRELFNKGVDAWWLDASEPELAPDLHTERSRMHPTAMGTGARMLNAFPLLNSEAVYEGQREAAPNQRVFILTRSAFAGQQRYAGAVWSGDISSTWPTMRAQITAGLGYSLSGLPYWTMDIGGFSVPQRFSRKDAKPEDVEEWRELNARWFEFGTFVPLLRVHGEFPYREMWEFGGDSSPACRAEVKFDHLRYRLLPYIYSVAGNVTHDSGTIMRALVMDFCADTNTWNIGDQFMFGPAFLVNPVTTYQARSRDVYLPQTAGGWYDFWTGSSADGGTSVDAAAPYDAIPLYVKAGSIIPTGPDLQYTGEKPADPITLSVYAGTDGDFTLYEDDGLSYAYEKGASSRIPIHWNDQAKTLTIGERSGSFKGMLRTRTFDVVVISKGKPRAYDSASVPTKSVKYTGREIKLSFQ
ncbi:MAG TPA: TIM-barrel domain-containing protein [Candidatus Angelobacter sp.]|nr:TIM-barrel domain-containing protein [Candidatus Angelobacter sp.]